MVNVVESGWDIVFLCKNSNQWKKSKKQIEDSSISLLKSKYTLTQLQNQGGNMMVPENATGKQLAIVLRKKARAEETHRKNYRVLEVF